MDQRIPGVAVPKTHIPTETPEGRTFIGGKSKELSPRSAPTAELPVMAAPPPEEKAEASTTCSSCSGEVSSEAFYCATCGTELGRKKFTDALGIKLTEEDVSDYLFKGFLAKEIELVKGRKGIFKTLLPKEVNELESKIVEEFKGKDSTNQQWTNQYALRTLSYCWIKFDGQSLGKDPDERYTRIMENMGSALVDIASKKWGLFNRAVIAMLEDPDVVKN